MLGASPSAPTYCDIEVDAVASSGDGIRLRRPDFYFVDEQEALWRYEDEQAKARAAGTKVILSEHLRQVIRSEKGPVYQYPCDLMMKQYPISYFSSHRIWVRGITVPMCGGGLALQFAVNHGGKDIHLVGLEGYRGEGHKDYFTGQMGNSLGIKYTKVVYGPFVRKVVTRLQDVHFTFYGDLSYEVEGDNVTFVTGETNPAQVLSRGLSLKE